MDTVELIISEKGRKAIARFGSSIKECSGEAAEVRKFVRMVRSVARSNGYAVVRKTAK